MWVNEDGSAGDGSFERGKDERKIFVSSFFVGEKRKRERAGLYICSSSGDF